MSNENALITKPEGDTKSPLVPEDVNPELIYSRPSFYEFVLRGAKLLASQTILPVMFRGNIPNCVAAIQMSYRLGVDTLTFAQNCHEVHGKLGMDGKLIIAIVNRKGGFAHNLRFDITGTGDLMTCRCWTRTKEGDVLEYKMSIADAKKFGWFKNEKWTQMPDQMLRYRTAAFFARANCPEVILGLPAMIDELEDIELSKQPAGSWAKPLIPEVLPNSGPETPSSIVAEFNPGTNKEGQVQMFASPKPKARSALSEGV